MNTHAKPDPAPPPPHHVCPWWVGYLLVSPLRKLAENPTRMLGPHLSPGMRVLDFGASMGFFSLPAARLVGPTGKVVCVDIQRKALAALRRRARRAGLEARMEMVLATNGSQWMEGLEASFDVALAIHVVHELPDARTGLERLVTALKPGGKLLLAEPQGHVSRATYDAEVGHVRGLGLSPAEALSVRRSHIGLFVKQAPDVASMS